MEVQRYSPLKKADWNTFVENSKNGTFMLNRDYMDYHSDRFTDHSLMFYDDNGKLKAVLPASQHGNELRSHGGLTYGGIIIDRNTTQQNVLEIFDILKGYMSTNDIHNLIYKRVPNIYYSYPSDEDLYALFKNDASLIRRDISTTIDFSNPISFSERRRRNIKKSVKSRVVVHESMDFDKYIELLTEILKCRHNAVPVHSSKEIHLLRDRFPNNIKMIAAYLGNQMLAGSILFITPKVVHTQYLMSTDEGRKVGGLDAVINYVVELYKESHRYLDFGISTESGGLYLNDGLITQKQEFGGRAIAYDFYELKV